MSMGDLVCKSVFDQICGGAFEKAKSWTKLKQSSLQSVLPVGCTYADTTTKKTQKHAVTNQEGRMGVPPSPPIIDASSGIPHHKQQPPGGTLVMINFFFLLEKRDGSKKGREKKQKTILAAGIFSQSRS